MTDIGHIANVPVDSTYAPHGRTLENRPNQEPTAMKPGSNRLAAVGDRVEISDHARHLAKIKAMPEVRLDRVEAARAAIENGTLDTDEALRDAIEIMITESELL